MIKGKKYIINNNLKALKRVYAEELWEQEVVYWDTYDDTQCLVRTKTNESWHVPIECLTEAQELAILRGI